jgi:mannose/fructose/N-acetylgalactosamine-specific phosphotransferase system component IIC
MTAFRLISLSAHGALELLIGMALLASPFVLGFGAAGTLIALVIGALTVGLALGAAVADMGSFDIAAHYAFDVAVAVGLVGAALALAIAGDATAAGVFVGAAIAQLGLTLTTRYSLAS